MATQEDQTVRSICNTYTGIFITPHPHQLTNLHAYCSKLLDVFNQDKKYDKEQEILMNLFFKPIEFLKDKYGDDFKLPKNPVEWNASNIEWVVFRSQKFPTKLGKDFVIDSKKASDNKTVSLAQCLTIAFLYKREIDRIFNKILIKEKINFSFNFDAFIQQKGDILGKN